MLFLPILLASHVSSFISKLKERRVWRDKITREKAYKAVNVGYILIILRE